VNTTLAEQWIRPEFLGQVGLHSNQHGQPLVWGLSLAGTRSDPESPLKWITAAEPAPAVIALQPLGEVKAERLLVVKLGLEKAYGLEVETLPAKPLPKAAWYEPRARYRADILLDELVNPTPGTYRIVIGLTAKDISVTKDQHGDWGIFGLGQLAGRACVVSTFRLGARGRTRRSCGSDCGRLRSTRWAM